MAATSSGPPLSEDRIVRAVQTRRHICMARSLPVRRQPSGVTLMLAPANGLPRAVSAALEHGWSLLPVNLYKKPLLDEWGWLQTERPTLEQVSQWHTNLHPVGWAVV